jgi:hypothetical protein
VQSLNCTLKSPLHSGDSHGNILAAKPIIENCETLRGGAKAPRYRAIKTKPQFIKVLISPVDGVTQTV